MATKRAPKKSPAPVITHALMEHARPVAGERLFAHTAAFLNASGLMDGNGCSVDLALKVMGPTAVKYHRMLGTLALKKDAGLTITDKGRAHFSARAVEPKLAEAYSTMLFLGKADGEVVKENNVVKLG